MYHSLALFDLDNTLLPIDSDFEWGEFLCRSGIVDANEYRTRNAEFLAQYRAGRLDAVVYTRFALGALTRLPRATLLALQARYMSEVIAPAIHPRARALVASHRERGDLCAVITATNAFVTAPIAEALGVDHLVATVPEQREGRFTGEIVGPACYQAGKIACTAAWLERQGRAWDSFTHTTFYSDSHNDLALLSHVDVPVATNPDEVLRAHAREHGWRILELFDDPQIH